MAYELHIRRLNDKGTLTPIPFEDWEAALSATEGVRLCPPGEDTFKDPETGDTISIPRRSGDAETYSPGDQAWHPTFRWFRGAAHVNARAMQLGDPLHPVWKATSTLASKLDAVICGDEGEVYDLQTGEVTGAI